MVLMSNDSNESLVTESQFCHNLAFSCVKNISMKKKGKTNPAVCYVSV